MPPQLVTIPLGGTDYAGQPLPPQTQYLVADAGDGLPGVPYRSQAPAQPAGDGLPGVPYQAPVQPSGAEQQPDISGGQALISGLAHGATFGTAPNIAGLAAASGMELPKQGPGGALDQPAGMAILQPIVGAYKMLTEGGDRVRAYNEARDKALKDYEETRRQHPYITAGGEIAGGLAVTPALGPLGSLRAATGLGRVAQGVKVGAVTGGLTGAGEATGRGESPLDVAAQGAVGAASGAALGGALGGATEGAAQTVGKIASLRRGKRDPELEAARQVQGMFQGPGARAYEKVRADRPALRAGSESGAPMVVGDFGGRPAGGLLRSATDLSPEARDLATETLGPRYAQQGARVREWILSKFGGRDTDATTIALKQQARRENSPAYKRAYTVAAARFPMGLATPELAGLVRSSPTLRQALVEAEQQSTERAASEGVGRSMQPRLSFDAAGNLTQFPDLQLWDYAQRILRDKARSFTQNGEESRGGSLFGIHSQVLGELDRATGGVNGVFAQARGTAAAFFKANDALEAGQKFVTATDISDGQAIRAIRKMNPTERQLFAQGFSGELAERVGARGDSANVLNNMFVNSDRARRRIAIALGPQAAAELEAVLRVEGIMQRFHNAVGGSQTSTNLSGMARLGASIASAGELIHGLNPVPVIAGLIALGSRQAARAIDEQVATKIAEMLLSSDPAVVARGYKVVAANPVLREAIRRASDLASRELISQAGPYNVGAGLMTVGGKLTGTTSKPPEHPHSRYYEEDLGGGPPVSQRPH